MKKVIFLIIPVIMLCACSQTNNKNTVQTVTQKPATSSEKELQEANAAFAKMCVDEGLKETFMAYATPDAILMREGDPPVIGLDSIEKHLGQGKNVQKLTLQTEKTDVASNNDLGYVFGPWKMDIKGKNGQEKSRGGYYTSIWRKQSDSTWKFTLFCMTSISKKDKQDKAQKDKQGKDASNKPGNPNKYY